MTYLKAFLLGLVQGVAEFLPISSSGHLAIARNLLNMEGAGDIPEFFDVLLHLGTLIAVFIAYWSDIRDMVVEFFRGIRDLAHRTTPTPVPPARRLILLIIIGTLPILIAGLLFKDAIESTLRNLWITVTVLIIFGILLWVVDARAKQVKTMDEMTWKDALIFGIGQMLALIPGVSRSGGTITFGRAMGYTREAAVRVSFLMAIPAVLGAGILEAVSAVKDVAAGNAGMFPGWGATIAATIVAFVVGYVVIIGFLKFVSTFSYKAFAIYRIALAVVVALLLICGVLHPTEVVAAA